jgi:hypothetical protein
LARFGVADLLAAGRRFTTFFAAFFAVVFRAGLRTASAFAAVLRRVFFLALLFVFLRGADFLLRARFAVAMLMLLYASRMLSGFNRVCASVGVQFTVRSVEIERQQAGG